jgi:hypothetical protein
VKGQLWNCIFNYVLIFGGIVLVDKLLSARKGKGFSSSQEKN